MTDNYDHLHKLSTHRCGGHDHGHNHKCCGKHGHGIGEGHHSEHTGCCGGHRHDTTLSVREESLLHLIKTQGCIPIVSFVMKSSKSSHLESVALAPVYLTDQNDDIDTVKSNGADLKRLSDGGYISLDYDITISNYDYSEYLNSKIYLDFCNMMNESSENPDFVFDIAEMEKGSAALCVE